MIIELIFIKRIIKLINLHLLFHYSCLLLKKIIFKFFFQSEVKYKDNGKESGGFEFGYLKNSCKDNDKGKS